MERQYEVLNPWADVDPIPLKGIALRLDDLNNKKIGLFHNDKVSTAPSLALIEAALKEKYSQIEFSRFLRTPNISMAEIKEWDNYVDWVKGLDALIFGMGD